MTYVKQNEICLEYSSIAEFCRAASLIKDANFIYLRYSGSAVDLYSEGSSSTAYLSIPFVSNGVGDMHAGFNKDRFVAIFKKMYEGDVSFKFTKTRVNINLDNIRVKLPIISPKSKYKAPVILSTINDSGVVSELSNSFISCTMIDIDKKGENKFPGILFDNSDFLRVCKFSTRSLCFSSSEKLFEAPYRVVVSDDFAGSVRSFKKDIISFGFTDRHSTILLKNGTVVYFTLMYDSYPKDYLNMWGFSSGLDLIPDVSVDYTFFRDSLLNSVDLIGTALGDTEHWVYLETIGLSGDSLVWRLSGKSHENVEIHEDITCEISDLMASNESVVSKFSVNKKTLLMLLGMFGDTVRVCNFNSSFLALANEEGSLVSLLLKAAR